MITALVFEAETDGCPSASPRGQAHSHQGLPFSPRSDGRLQDSVATGPDTGPGLGSGTRTWSLAQPGLRRWRGPGDCVQRPERDLQTQHLRSHRAHRRRRVSAVSHRVGRNRGAQQHAGFAGCTSRALTLTCAELVAWGDNEGDFPVFPGCWWFGQLPICISTMQLPLPSLPCHALPVGWICLCVLKWRRFLTSCIRFFVSSTR